MVNVGHLSIGLLSIGTSYVSRYASRLALVVLYRTGCIPAFERGCGATSDSRPLPSHR